MAKKAGNENARIAREIMEVYRPETVAEMQDALKDILGLWLNETESKHHWMQIF